MPGVSRSEASTRRRAPIYIGRALLTLAATILSLFLAAWILPGVTMTDGAVGVVSTAIVVAILNALLWPLVIRFALPFTVLTFGLGALAAQRPDRAARVDPRQRAHDRRASGARSSPRSSSAS